MIWLGIKILCSVILFVLIAGVAYLPVSWLRQRFRVRHEREHHINIHHKANFRAFYYLAVESLQPALRFCVMAGNLPLVDVSQQVADVEVAVSSPARSVAVEKTKTASPAAAPPSPHSIQQQALDSTSKAVAKTGTIANLLGAFAGLVPGPVGDKARQAQEGVRSGQVKAAKAVQAPKQAQQRMSVLQSESQKLGGNAPAAKQALPAAAAKQASAATMNSRAVDSWVDAGDNNDYQANPIQHPFGGLYCVKTFELDPEQTLPLTLMISSATGRPPVGSSAYTVHLQVVPIEQLDEKIPASYSHGTVHYEPVPAWRSFIPGFVSLLIALLGLLIWFYSLVFIWQ